MSEDAPTRDDVRAAKVFDEHRRLLVSVAYRVLGRHADAEDVVQDAWLRWSGTDYASVEDPKAFLVTVTTRLAIDQLRKAQTRKESYVGPWLPEPVLTSAVDGRGGIGGDVADKAVLDDTVSMAMLLVMETLSPLERAVFVLREAFDYSYPEIARMLDRSEPAVRQLAVRARAHVQERRPRFPADDAARRRIAENFLAAATGGSVAPLLELLSPGVTLIADGGGMVSAARRPVHGAMDVARFVQGIVAKGMKLLADGVDLDFGVASTAVNGSPAIVLTANGAVYYVYILEMDEDGRVSDIFAVANPAKLEALRALAASNRS
jgi:RNA polymerase sigma-70 factor (ECF subfamily)